MHSVHFICDDNDFIGEKSKTQVEALERWLGTVWCLAALQPVFPDTWACSVKKAVDN